MAEYNHDCDICHTKLKDPRKSACGHWFCGIHFESTNAGGITGRVCPYDCKSLQISKEEKWTCSCKREMGWIEAMNNPTGCPHEQATEEPLPFPVKETQEPDAACFNRPATEEIIARSDEMVRAMEDREEQATIIKDLQARLREEEERREKMEKGLAKEKALREKYVGVFRKLNIAYRNVIRDLRASAEAPLPTRDEMEQSVVDDRQPEGASTPPAEPASVDLHPRSVTLPHGQADVKVTMQMVDALDSSLALGGGVEKTPATFQEVEMEKEEVE